MSTFDPFVSTLHEWVEIFMRRSMHSFIQYARKNGLSMSQISALLRIHHQKSCGVTDLGDHLGVTNAAVSQMIDRLVQQELISRSEDPYDRRMKNLVLTEEGERIVQQGIRTREEWMDTLSDVLSNDEKKQVTAALQILIEKSKDFEPLSEIEK